MTAADYLKYGSMGFAALILAGTLALYQGELRKRRFDEARGRWILSFMVFAFLLLLVSASLEFLTGQRAEALAKAELDQAFNLQRAQYDSELASQKEANKAELDKLTAIHSGVMYEALGALQEIERGKFQVVAHQITDVETRTTLFYLLADFCERIRGIKDTLGGPRDRPAQCDEIRLQR